VLKQLVQYHTASIDTDINASSICWTNGFSSGKSPYSASIFMCYIGRQ